jgi:SagB-type dehydrogenase family enzyme
VLKRSWAEIVLPSGDPNHVWELFHENSKTGRFEAHPPDEFVVAQMKELHESLPYDGYPEIELPQDLSPMPVSLGQAIVDRVSCRQMEPAEISMADLATLLYCAYGVTRSNENSIYTRPFRTVPSGGGLYPLEIYFNTAHVAGLEPGLYHYNAVRHRIYRLREGDLALDVADGLVQKNLAVDASIVFFLTAMFDRSVFKYGDRGYRFVMLEAGHVAQNLNLVACGLGLGSLNIGGYFDRRIDDFLGLDGVTHSTIYMVAVGKSVTTEDVASEV